MQKLYLTKGPVEVDFFAQIAPERIKFLSERPVGSGMYGCVYEAVDNQKRRLAVKLLNYLDSKNTAQSPMREPRRALMCIREIHIAKFFAEHPNIRSPYEAIFVTGKKELKQEDQLFIVTPFLSLGLQEAVQKHAWDDLMWPIRDLMCGLHGLHTAHVAHRDLKPDNLLVAQVSDRVTELRSYNRPVLQIIDFGFGRLIESHDPNCVGVSVGSNGDACAPAMTAYVGSPPWRAPELILETNLDRNPNIQVTSSLKVDIWSAGIIALEIVAGVYEHKKCLWFDKRFGGRTPRHAPKDGGSAVWLMENMMMLAGVPNRTRVEAYLSSLPAAVQAKYRLIVEPLLPHYCDTPGTVGDFLRQFKIPCDGGSPHPIGKLIRMCLQIIPDDRCSTEDAVRLLGLSPAQIAEVSTTAPAIPNFSHQEAPPDVKQNEFFKNTLIEVLSERTAWNDK